MIIIILLIPFVFCFYIYYLHMWRLCSKYRYLTVIVTTRYRKSNVQAELWGLYEIRVPEK